MACMLCGSENQDLFNAEFVLSCTKLEAVVKNSPAYMVRKPLVCLECGFMEVFVRQTELREIRKGYAALQPLSD
jgi:hypothetical protein